MRKDRFLRSVLTGMLAAAMLVGAVPVQASKDELHSYYGLVNSSGIDCQQQNFKLTLPEDYVITDRGEVTINGETEYCDPNEDRVLGLVELNSMAFEAKNDWSTVRIYVSDSGIGYDKWADVIVVAKNDYEDFINEMETDPDYADGQGTISQETFAGQTCYVNRYSCTLYEEPYYRAEILMMDKDNQYLTQVFLSCWYEDQLDTLMSYFTQI